MDAWESLSRDWMRALAGANRGANTKRLYALAVRQLHHHLLNAGRTVEPAEVTRGDVSGFLAAYAEDHAPATVSVVFRALQQWWGFLLDEQEIAVSPMARMKPPIVPEQPVPVLTLEQLRALLKSCAGKDFVDRRDAAIILLLADTGGRLAEIANLTVADVDTTNDVVHVLGKGRRPRALPFGQATGLALGRYVRARDRDPWAGSDRLWLAEKGRGPLAPNGNAIKLMLRRRGAAVGIDNLHAHRFRHTAAHRWLADGGGETDLMRLMGWRSPAMLRRYGASKADERAREAHKRYGLLGDKL